MPGLATGVWLLSSVGNIGNFERRQATRFAHNTGAEIKMNFANVLGLAAIAIIALTTPQTVRAQHTCIANYSTDGIVGRVAKLVEI